MALHEHGGDIGVEAHCEQHRGHLRGGFAQYMGLIGDREGMQVDDAVERIALVLARHPVA